MGNIVRAIPPATNPELDEIEQISEIFLEDLANSDCSYSASITIKTGPRGKRKKSAFIPRGAGQLFSSAAVIIPALVSRIRRLEAELAAERERKP